LAFGCGAHSEIALAEKEPVGAPTQDFVGFDTLDLDQADVIVVDVSVEVAAESVDASEAVDASESVDQG
jgi:hypothetical protein